MLGIKVTILRYVSDDPQPGIVECQFEDAYGRLWSFVEKTAIVSAKHLDAQTVYPQLGVVAVEVISSNLDANGREVIKIDTDRPWGVSIEGVTRFEILPELLVEWEPLRSNPH